MSVLREAVPLENTGNGISATLNFKILWGSMLPDPLVTRASGPCLHSLQNRRIRGASVKNRRISGESAIHENTREARVSPPPRFALILSCPTNPLCSAGYRLHGRLLFIIGLLLSKVLTALLSMTAKPVALEFLIELKFRNVDI